MDAGSGMGRDSFVRLPRGTVVLVDRLRRGFGRVTRAEPEAVPRSEG